MSAIAPYTQQLSHTWVFLPVLLYGLLFYVPVRNSTSQRLLLDIIHWVKYVLEVRAVVQRFNSKTGILEMQQSSAGCGTQTIVKQKEIHRRIRAEF